MKKIVKKILGLSLGVFSVIGLSMASIPANAATLSQKETYYKEYQTIVQNAKEKYNAKIELLPIITSSKPKKNLSIVRIFLSIL